MSTVRRRRIGRGDPHQDVESALVDAKGTTTLVALALFDDPGRGGEVMTRINKWGRRYGDVYKDCQKGSHELFSGNLETLIEHAENLAVKIEAQS